MSKHEVCVADQGASLDLLLCVTAEAWMNPDFEAALKSDKVGAISQFAREQNIPLLETSLLEQFELSENPLGEGHSARARLPEGLPARERTPEGMSITCVTAMYCGYTMGCPPPPPPSGPPPGVSLSCSVGCYTASGCTIVGCGP